MDNERRHNVMSVELAIQRELAYREKVEMLGLQPYSGLKTEYLPLQLPHASPISSSTPNPEPRPSPTLSASQCLAGIKRKEPSSTSSLQCQPPQQLQSTAGDQILEIQQHNHFCKVCQVPCSGALNFKMHLRGKQHRAKVQELKLSGKGKEKASQWQWCELCKISCTDGNTFKLHLTGQKHKVKLQELELGRKDSGVKANQPQWCKLCKIWCMDEVAFKQHLEGKKHILNLHATGGKGKAEEDEAALAMIELKDLE